MNRSTVRSGVVAVAALLALFPATAMAATPTAAPASPAPPAASGKTGVVVAYHHKIHTQGVVVTGHGRQLHVRTGAGTAYKSTYTLRSGHKVYVLCKKNGTSVHGNHIWYRLAGHHGYVSARYIRVAPGASVPWC
uniref:SH3 domain-containing protein n=1 Tax=Streptomyces sp. NBC_00003 TaxID=2903608 RepID=A0AAU2V6K0_9ACTN